MRSSIVFWKKNFLLFCKKDIFKTDRLAIVIGRFFCYNIKKYSKEVFL